MKIWISGSIARDIIMDFPGKFRDFIDPKKIHVLSLAFAVDEIKKSLGGTAANICYNLALLSEKPEIVGSIGTDGLDIKKHLQKLDVGTKYLGISKKRETATAYIITDKDDNQIAGFYAGATIEPIKIPQVKQGDWAIVSPDPVHNMMTLIKYYTKKKVNYIFDPGQRITAFSNSQLKMGIMGARVVMGNDYEIGMIQKKLSPFPNPSHRGRGIPPPLWGRLGGGKLIIVRTLGPKGSEILEGKTRIHIGIAKPWRVVDPTGAGDAYRAGFLKGLVLGYNLRQCGELGAAIASFAVEKYGTQNHKFTWKEVERRLKRQPLFNSTPPYPPL